MEENPLLETVYQAIETLYHNPDCNKKNEANRWLIDLQNSVYAWKVGDELLQRQVDVNSCYFGAQIIRNKIICSFHELPQDAVVSLHNSLMQHLKKITKETDSIIVTQLCVSVVDLSLQMSTWSNPISTFLNQCNDIPTPVLLDILKVFPEEIDTKVIRLGANRRHEIENELSSCAPLLNTYLKEVTLRDSSPETLLKALGCFSSWVNIIKNISDIVECDLIPKVFQILTDPTDTIYDTSSSVESKLHDSAADLLCNILRNLRRPDAHNMLDLNLYSKVATFENAYHNSVARECIDKSISYCRIFTELAEAFLVKMVNESKPGSPHFSLQVLDLVLICVGHHDYEVGLITFNFWFSLTESLYNEESDDVVGAFKPYINRLLTSLCQQVQMEPDSEGLLDDADDFKSFRDKVCDLIRDSIFIVGSTNTFCQISMSIHPDLSWDQLEAILFVMYSVAWKISPGENNVVPGTVQKILSFPTTSHIAVRHTALLIIGELRDWFNEHPYYLVPALTHLQFNLHIEELRDAAAGSLCFICCSAKTKLTNEFAPLLEILKNLHTLGLKNKSAIKIIEGVVAVMCQLSTTEIIVALKTMCTCQTDPLLKLLKDQNSSTGTFESGALSDPIVWLDRIAAIFRFIEQPASNDANGLQNDVSSACVAAFTEIHPILFQTMDAYQKQSVVMERCCRCIRFGIRALGKSGVFILESLVQKLVQLYQGNGHSCFLYLSSVLVDEYGSDSGNWKPLLEMLDAFILPTFNLLQTANGLRDNPDTIDDLFRLCCRVLQRLPIAFLRSSSVWSLLECALAAVPIDHREANSSVMKFLHEVFDCSGANDHGSELGKRESIRRIYETKGEAVVRDLVHASVFTLPSYTLVNVAEVLFDLIKFDSQVTLRWIESAVQQLPNKSPAGSMMASPEQIQVFLGSCEQATKTRDVSKALRDFTLYYC